ALDGAIKSISGTRAGIGTFINRLEYTVNNIANLEFNTQDAESRIRDTDFAKETTNFTKNQIMVQSATSMLAQANSLPQSVLGLLG
ncbi:MAG: flagellin, partial [Fibromonadales bacterium]|nr:flagellin [Fibromonadales bacterium]